MKIKRKIMPPVYLIASLLAMTGLHFYLPLKTLFTPPPNTTLSVVFIAIGLIIIIWPAAKFLILKTGLIPFRPATSLVTTGLYRITRNPMYLGMVFILIGVAIYLGTISPFFVIPLFIWVIQARFIRYEELFLEDAFGESYREYKGRVRRWL